MNATARTLTEWIGRHREPMLTLVEDLARLESPSSDPSRMDAAFRRCAREFSGLGWITSRFPGRDTGGWMTSRPGHRRKTVGIQLLVGHLDTVWPAGTLETMPVHRENGCLYGPGVFDMKGGIAQMIYAVKALDGLGLMPTLLPVVFLNGDEEIGSRESGPSLKRLARIASRSFILEPSVGPDGRLKTSRKGIGRFTLDIHGRAAHAGLDPEAGASAILELARQVQSLHALNDPDRGISVNVGLIEGGVAPNMVAPTSRAVVDVRVRHQKDGERVTRQILGLQPSIPGVSLRIAGGIGRPPMESTPRNRRLWLQAREAAAGLGLDLQEVSAGGGSDGNTTSQFTATLDGLGPVGEGAHASHEHLVVDKLMERTTLLAMLLMMPLAQATGHVH